MAHKRREAQVSFFIMDSFYTYALFSEQYNKIYIGYSSDVNRRLLAHNDDRNKGWTAKFRPWKIIYTESSESKSEAMKREKQLKTAKGREFIWSIIKNN
jgi:putative endonuclease